MPDLTQTVQNCYNFPVLLPYFNGVHWLSYAVHYPIDLHPAQCF